MPIFLKPDETVRLVKQFHTNVDGFTGAWENAYDGKFHFSKLTNLSRSSIYKWINHGIPSKGGKYEHQLFAFCALLDVDPLAIFDYARNGFFLKFAKLRRMLSLGREASGALGPLFDMYAPSELWPSDEIATKFYGRPWYSKEFSNAENWKSPDYALVIATFGDRLKSHPLAVHIAYRRLGSTDTMWRYYGTVISINGHLELYSEGGAFQTMKQPDDCQIRFRTYYGGRPVQFRLVSLHEFRLDKPEVPYSNKETIGFEW